MKPESASRTAYPVSLLWPGLAIGLGIMVAAFLPGLSGPFLFDDLGSLGDLGRYGGIDDWHTFTQFVFGGNTGPTGRPLSLLSFLIDGTDWPTDPWPFKRTNLVIHGLNAVLIGLFVRQVLSLHAMSAARISGIAAFCAVAWAVHPFLVSTVLYPVQRMAQLAALFSFAGLNIYVLGRRLLPTQTRKAYLIMSSGLVGCSLLATLSKENGALLPLLAGVVEVTVIASQRGRLGRLNRLWALVFLVLPGVIIAAYLLRIGLSGNFFSQQTTRNFSTYERLLTEARILFDYLRHWFIPPLYTSGIFQDHIVKSTSLLHPWTTAVSLLLHAAILFMTWSYRRRLPLLAFAVLFYYAGHLLESTVVSLELYFEHRNYLPAAFLLLPAAVWVSDRIPARLAATSGLIIVVLLAGFTRYSSTIWASYPEMVKAAASVAPESARAQQQYASLLLNQGRTGQAIEVTNRALALRPHDQNLNLWHAILLCKADALTAAQFDAIAEILSDKVYDLRSLSGYESLVGAAQREECGAVTPERLGQLFSSMLRQPTNSDPKGPMFAQLKFLLGQVKLLQDDPRGAMNSFQASLESRPGAGVAMAMAARFAAQSYYDEAMSLSNIAIDYFGGENEPRGLATGVTRDDILEFQSQLREAMNP